MSKQTDTHEHESHKSKDHGCGCGGTHTKQEKVQTPKDEKAAPSSKREHAHQDDSHAGCCGGESAKK